MHPECRPGTDRFHTSGPPAHTGPPGPVHRQMSQLPRRSAPAQNLPTVQNRTTDPGANGQHHHIGTAPRRPTGRFAQQCHRAIILDHHRQPRPALHFTGKVQAREIDIAPGCHPAAARFHFARHTDPDCRHPRAPHLCDQVKAAVQHRLRVAQTRCPAPRFNPAIRCHPRNAQPRSPDIEAKGCHPPALAERLGKHHDRRPDHRIAQRSRQQKRCRRHHHPRQNPNPVPPQNT